MPVVIDGDLNTGNGTGGDFESERLFAVARDRGFVRHSGEPGQTTVRQSRITVPDYPYKLDWFLTRDVDVTESRIVPALGPGGEALTDHELVTLTIAGLAES